MALGFQNCKESPDSSQYPFYALPSAVPFLNLAVRGGKMKKMKYNKKGKCFIILLLYYNIYIRKLHEFISCYKFSWRKGKGLPNNYTL